MELKLGKMTGKELAEWFGIGEGSFKNNKEKKLEELKYFADYHLEGNKTKKVIIDKIYEPVYSKKEGGDTYQEVINKIDEIWSENGLDSCSRVGYEICELLDKEGVSKTPGTIIEYTRKGRNELYGKPFQEGGKLGNCIYIWCKRDAETGRYNFLTEEEQKIKSQLQTKYFGDVTEKQILVKGMVEVGEISKEEAWDVLEELTNMRTGNFMMFLKELQQKVGCQVVRGTLVERKRIGEWK